jgi:hypothetical protein
VWLGVAKLAVAVTVAGPTFSKAIDDADVAAWSHAGGVAHLIRAAWTEGEAVERRVIVSDEDVREAMDPPHDGLTRAQRLYEARIGLLDAALKAPVSQAAAQSVSQAQIDAYVAAHPKFQPARRSVYVMRLRNRRTAQQAVAALRRGLSLKSATKRYAHKRTGLILARPGQLDPQGLDRRIFKARPGTYSRYGTVVFKVRTIEAPQPLPADQQSAQAWELLASEAQQRALAEYEANIKATWRPRTTCATPATTPDFCSNSPTVQ